MRAQLHKQVQSTHKFSRPRLCTRMIATNSATLLRGAGVFFTVKLCDLGDADIQAMCGAIRQRRKKILNFARSSDGELRAILRSQSCLAHAFHGSLCPAQKQLLHNESRRSIQWLACIGDCYSVRLTWTSSSVPCRAGHGPWWTLDARLERGYVGGSLHHYRKRPRDVLARVRVRRVRALLTLRV